MASIAQFSQFDQVIALFFDSLVPSLLTLFRRLFISLKTFLCLLVNVESVG